MITETVLKQVRNRLGPLTDQAEQAVAQAVEIIRQMNGLSFSPTETKDDDFKGENVSLEEYESWSNEQQRRYLVEAKKNNTKWIETKLHELNAAWLIVVDGKIKAHGPALQTFPHEEEFEAFCKKIGKFPFVIFSPRIFFIEESALWHSTKLSNDAYPTLHLGRSFDYVTKSIWMELRDKNGQSRQERVYGICVENWRNSPFVAINPNRTALVGRGMMLKLQPMVGLDFANRQTEVEYRQIPTS